MNVFTLVHLWTGVGNTSSLYDSVCSHHYMCLHCLGCELSTGIWHHAAQLSCRIMLGGTGLSFMAPVSRTGNQERVTVDPHELAQPPGFDSPHGRLSQKNPPLFLEQEAGLWKVGMRWKFSSLLPFTCWTASVQFSIWTCGHCCSSSSSSACALATKVRPW